MATTYTIEGDTVHEYTESGSRAREAVREAGYDPDDDIRVDSPDEDTFWFGFADDEGNPDIIVRWADYTGPEATMEDMIEGLVSLTS